MSPVYFPIYYRSSGKTECHLPIISSLLVLHWVRCAAMNLRQKKETNSQDDWKNTMAISIDIYIAIHTHRVMDIAIQVYVCVSITHFQFHDKKIINKEIQ